MPKKAVMYKGRSRSCGKTVESLILAYAYNRRILVPDHKRKVDLINLADRLKLPVPDIITLDELEQQTRKESEFNVVSFDEESKETKVD
jgi:hypothetical protein